MRIVYFINGFDPGGAEHGLLTLIESGFFAGHDLHVLAICRGRGPLADKIKSKLEKDHFHLVDDREDLTLIACARAVLALGALIAKLRPEKVVLSLKQANVIGRWVLYIFPSVTCVAFEHISRYRAKRAEGLYGTLLTALSGRVDEIWSDCQETLDATRHYFKPRKRQTFVVPLFRVVADQPVKATYAVDGPFKVAAAGRLVDRKNFDQLIRVIAAMRMEGLAILLTIFGDGPEMESLETLIADLAMQDHVHLAGYHADWTQLARSYDLFVNVSDTEGFCIVVAEAMALGLPVIATDVGGIREYGVDGVNMLKVEIGNNDSVKRAIRRVADNFDVRQNLGMVAARDMRSRFAHDAIIERVKLIF